MRGRSRRSSGHRTSRVGTDRLPRSRAPGPFLGDLLGVEIESRLGAPPQFVNLERQSRDAAHVSFQRVPEPKLVKNRVHLDIGVDDVELATSSVEALGGRRRRPDADFMEYGYCWRTTADPEGNECLIYKCPSP